MYKFLKHVWLIIYYYSIGTIAILEDIFYRRYNKCELQDLSGNVAVITGGARGIGACIVKKLLQCNMHVVIGCRDVAKGSEMVRSLRAQGITSGSTSILPLDMASLDSVQAFADAVLNSRPSLHLLINNAGIMFPPYSETVDGLESQWAVNYLGHFLLSHLLLPRLHKSSSDQRLARIVNVTSCAHHAAYPIDINNINMKDRYITQASYAQSKLAQLMFSLQLDRLLRSVNSPVSVVGVHPGIVNTDLFNGTFMKKIFPWIPGILFKSPEEGATTVMFAALEAHGGEYISNGGRAHMSEEAGNRTAQQKLFYYSMASLGIVSFGGMFQ